MELGKVDFGSVAAQDGKLGAPHLQAIAPRKPCAPHGLVSESLMAKRDLPPGPPREHAEAEKVGLILGSHSDASLKNLKAAVKQWAKSALQSPAKEAYLEGLLLALLRKARRGEGDPLRDLETGVRGVLTSKSNKLKPDDKIEVCRILLQGAAWIDHPDRKEGEGLPLPVLLAAIQIPVLEAMAKSPQIAEQLTHYVASPEGSPSLVDELYTRGEENYSKRIAALRSKIPSLAPARVAQRIPADSKMMKGPEPAWRSESKISSAARVPVAHAIPADAKMMKGSEPEPPLGQISSPARVPDAHRVPVDAKKGAMKESAPESALASQAAGLLALGEEATGEDWELLVANAASQDPPLAERAIFDALWKVSPELLRRDDWAGATRFARAVLQHRLPVGLVATRPTWREHPSYERFFRFAALTERLLASYDLPQQSRLEFAAMLWDRCSDNPWRSAAVASGWHSATRHASFLEKELVKVQPHLEANLRLIEALPYRGPQQLRIWHDLRLQFPGPDEPERDPFEELERRRMGRVPVKDMKSMAADEAEPPAEARSQPPGGAPLPAVQDGQAPFPKLHEAREQQLKGNPFEQELDWNPFEQGPEGNLFEQLEKDMKSRAAVDAGRPHDPFQPPRGAPQVGQPPGGPPVGPEEQVPGDPVAHAAAHPKGPGRPPGGPSWDEAQDPQVGQPPGGPQIGPGAVDEDDPFAGFE